jgi:hypothetical protein
MALEATCVLTVRTNGRGGTITLMAKYLPNEAAVAKARKLIDARQYVLDSDWGAVQPRADA